MTSAPGTGSVIVSVSPERVNATGALFIVTVIRSPASSPVRVNVAVPPEPRTKAWVQVRVTATVTGAPTGPLVSSPTVPAARLTENGAAIPSIHTWMTSAGVWWSPPLSPPAIGSTFWWPPWVSRTKASSSAAWRSTQTTSSPRPVLRVVSVRTPARRCVASTWMKSAPEPVQIVIPSANVPLVDARNVIAAGARPWTRISASAARCSAAISPAEMSSVMRTSGSPVAALSSLIIRRWRPSPASRFSVPRIASRLPVR